jgi:formate dehydrogenase major subunit
MVQVLVDGVAVEAAEGESLLHLLERTGRYVPHVCFQEGLGPLQSCETCLVAVDGKLQRSCVTPARAGLSVSVAKAAPAREQALSRLLRDHELACGVCDKNGECVLHDAVLRTGLRVQEYRPKGYPADETNPFYSYFPDHCILCGRCVEACQDLVVNEVLRIDWKANPPRVIWGENDPIDQSSCVSCGTCVTVCPVDALMPKSMIGQGGFLTRLPPPTKEKLIRLTKSIEPGLGGLRPVLELSEVEANARRGLVKRTKTVCTFCGVGCSFDVHTRGSRILKIQPTPEGPANGLATCVKGKFGWDFIHSPDRLTSPLIREGDHFRRASWEEALDLIALKVHEIRERSGPDALGVIADCTGSNEEAYLAQKLARAVIGTNNVDNCARYCQAPATTGLFRTVGIGGDAGSLEDIAGADLVITVGSNTAESHPVLAGKIKRARKLRGSKLVILDPRRQMLADHADLLLQPRPGSDVVVLNALARLLLEKGWTDAAFLRDRVNGLGEFRAAVETFTPEFCEKNSGIAPPQLEELARLVHEARSVCICWAMGVTQHQSGSETSTAISNVLLLTGNYGRPHTGAYPLRGHSNVQGASDFGGLPTFFPGYEKVDDPAIREKYEKGWGGKLPASKGLTSTGMVDAALEGRLRGLLIFGEDKVQADGRQELTSRALAGLDLLVVCDLFLTRTAQYAHVVLPAAAVLEKEGTVVNTERRIQRFYRALDPPGEAREELWILQELARRLGAPWAYGHPSEVMDEVASLSEFFAGVRYDRLAGYQSLQWPVAANGQDSPYLYKERFHFPDGKARLYPARWLPALPSTAEYDLYLNNGRMLEHFHWGNLTWRSPGIVSKVPEVFVEVSPELARERGLKDGDPVRLSSETGALKAKVAVTSRVTGRSLYLAIHGREDASINQVTSSVKDPVTGTPAYKEVPVRMEKLEEGTGRSPLPRSNPRLHPTVPQKGIGVEERWRRPEYAPLSG